MVWHRESENRMTRKRNKDVQQRSDGKADLFAKSAACMSLRPGLSACKPDVSLYICIFAIHNLYSRHPVPSVGVCEKLNFDIMQTRQFCYIGAVRCSLAAAYYFLTANFTHLLFNELSEERKLNGC